MNEKKTGKAFSAGEILRRATAALKAAAVEISTVPFYVTGYIAGAAVRAAVWCRDAVVAGYIAGRNYRFEGREDI